MALHFSRLAGSIASSRGLLSFAKFNGFDNGCVTQMDEVRADGCVDEVRAVNAIDSLNNYFNITLPILPQEPDCHPIDLLDRSTLSDSRWWLVYTRSRQEKQLMRHLRRLEVSHYAPQISHRRRSPAGRIRTTYAPLFNNYVFLHGNDHDRYQAVCTGAVLRTTEITDVNRLVSDLVQIRNLINLGVPLTIESRLEPGQHVRVRSGSFSGYEGTIVRREQETRLLVSVMFMDQGLASNWKIASWSRLALVTECRDFPSVLYRSSIFAAARNYDQRTTWTAKHQLNLPTYVYSQKNIR